jgi:PRTRC genetic system protein C
MPKTHKGKEYQSRVFIFEQNRWEDPGEQFTPEDIRTSYADYFPELNQATYKQKVVNGILEITFKKETGTKG